MKSMDVLRWAGSGIILGNQAAVSGGQSASADIMAGAAYQATKSGVVNSMTIRGSPSTTSSCNFRMAIYAATSQTVWSGALLGQTAVGNGLGLSETKRLALLAPVNIVAGNWYALCIQADPPGMDTGENGGYGDRYFADAYSDGPDATAGASAVNSGQQRCIFASTA